jgi:Ca-activated chloride channel homolog
MMNRFVNYRNTRTSRRTASRVFASLSFCVLLLQGNLASQVGQNSLSQTDQMVILNVRVTDDNGRAVADVAEERFQILEDGVKQKISLFSSEQIPLTYGLLIDNSGSLRSQIEKVISASKKIVNRNSPNDETFLIRFISSDKIQLVQELTFDKTPLLNGLDSLYVEAGQTAVIDAVYVGVDKLTKVKTVPANLRRKALILITDGEDRNSFYKPEQLFSMLGSTDIQVFVVGFTKELKERERAKALKLLNRLALDTGGRAFFPDSAGELDFISDEIINDIRTQYVIGYVPSNSATNASFHKLQVSITDDPNQEKRIAITRVGYAPGEKQRN